MYLNDRELASRPPPSPSPRAGERGRPVSAAQSSPGRASLPPSQVCAESAQDARQTKQQGRDTSLISCRAVTQVHSWAMPLW